ncbi:MAG: hypothetical protein PWQ82_1882 [Thermosediminibacterales bacterium]|nr:hypothetical protein [Thermosediminibacterales bacterium]MDK2836916.1 hypothetical protein [Thermosediminibacterales bacterium]
MALAKEIDATHKSAWLMLHKIRKAMKDHKLDICCQVLWRLILQFS